MRFLRFVFIALFLLVAARAEERGAVDCQAKLHNAAYDLGVIAMNGTYPIVLPLAPEVQARFVCPTTAERFNYLPTSEGQGYRLECPFHRHEYSSKAGYQKNVVSK